MPTFYHNDKKSVRKRGFTLKGSLLVFLGACSYGALSTIVVLAYGAGFTLNDVVGCQMVIGALLLWITTLVTKNRKTSETFKKATPNQILLLMLAGTSTGLTGLFYYMSLKYLPASLAVVLFFQFAWMGLVLEAIVERKVPNKGQLFSLIPIFIGTFLATNLFSNGLQELNWYGILFGLLAAMSNTIFIFISGRIAINVNPMVRSAYMVTGGAILCSIIVPPTFLLSGKLLLQLLSSYGLLLALFGSLFGTIMFSKGVPHVGAGLASLICAMQLPVTMLLSVVVLHDSITLSQLVGIMVILAGISLPELLTRIVLKQPIHA